MSGGDIRNAVLKAALAAAGEDTGDAFKAIHQRHFEDGIREVIAGRRVMQQSLFDPAAAPVRPGVIETARLLPAAGLLLGATALALLLSIAALLVALLR